MATVRTSDVLLREPELELVRSAGGAIFARDMQAGGLFSVVEADFDLLSELLDAFAEPRRVGAACEALSERVPEPALLEILEQLVQAGWLKRPPVKAPQPEPHRVLLLGEGTLARSIGERLARSAQLRMEQAAGPAPWPALDEHRARARYPGARSKHAAAPSGVGDSEGTELAARCRAADLVVCALEEAAFGQILVVEQACQHSGRPCLFVSYEAGRIFVGPTSVPGPSANFRSARVGLGCAAPGADAAQVRSTLELWTAQRIDATTGGAEQLLERASRAVSNEVQRVFDEQRTPELLSAVLIFDAHDVTQVEVPMAEEPTAHERDGDAALAVDADIALAHRANLTPRGAEPVATRITSVGIVGGGTAGYLTALALRKKLPQLDVTLIESSAIPIIGVGEATTALLVHFLHEYLELDAVDFYARVLPTWKLGIRFEWGPAGPYYYNSPFQFGKLLEALVYEQDINRSCLASRLMSCDRVPVFARKEGSPRWLLDEVPYAYHLDNQRFVRYLREQALHAGVRHVDATIADVQVAQAGIERLHLQDGRSLTFDLYVDCTGFRSLLMEKALGSPFRSYASSLFTDTAIMADIPGGETIRPYTTAETMEHGWCWNIPMRDGDHRGYVYASAFCSEEQAVAEMRAKNPRMGEHWTTRFRSGRHEHFWKDNVVAIGNAYGFVEPLQSTALHMIIVQIQKMIEAFPPSPTLRAFQHGINQRVGAVWDVLRYFLAAHYRYNDKLDTPFWRECRSGCDITGIEDMLALYQERAPIGSTGARFAELDQSTFGVFRHDLLFMGQQVPTQLAEPSEDRQRWLQTSAALDRLVGRALTHRDALALVGDAGRVP